MIQATIFLDLIELWDKSGDSWGICS